MGSDSRGKAVVRLMDFIDALPYFLLGTAVTCAGLVALVFWSLEQMRLGSHRNVVVVGLLAAALAIGFAGAARARRRVLSVAVALAWCGLFVALLADLGIRIWALGT